MRLEVEDQLYQRNNRLFVVSQSLLAIAAITGLAVPLAFPTRLSHEAKLVTMGLGFVSTIAGAAIAASDASERNQKLGQTLSNVRDQFIRGHLELEGGKAIAIQEIEAKRELAEVAELAGASSPIAAGYMAEQLDVQPFMPYVAPHPVIEDPEYYPPAIPVDHQAIPSNPHRKPAALPDGAKLITVKDLADINRYPVVMAIAQMGQGKTSTLSWILKRMEGIRVFVSPDAKTPDFPQYHKVFGAFGDLGNAMGTLRTDDRDLSNSEFSGSICEFLWRCFREIGNRQMLEKSEIQSLPIYRVFFDEMASVYSKLVGMDKESGKLMEDANRETFFNSRKHRIQMFYGAQSESVENVGLKNLGKARDEMWHLYPGQSAVDRAMNCDRPQLAGYLMDLQQRGKAIALLERSEVEFHVLDLPSVEELVSDSVQIQDRVAPDNPYKPPKAIPESEEMDGQTAIAAMVEWVKSYSGNGQSLTQEAIRAKFQELTGRSLSDSNLQGLLSYIKGELSRGMDDVA